MPQDTSAKSSPPAYCDLIMKGGITSGVVYPRLIAGLAEKYRFKNIGGASAGAIAAAGCAAAEFRRLRNADAGGFAELAKLPEFIGQEPSPGAGSRLRHLFQPSKALSRHFDVLIASLNQPSKLAIVVNALGTLLLRYWLPVALVAIAMLAVVVAVIRSTGPFGWGAAWTLATVVSGAWMVLGWLLIWYPARHQANVSVLPRFLSWWLGGMVVIFLVLSRANDAQWPSNALAAFSWGLALPLALGLAFALCAWKFVTSLLSGLHANFWGICSGLARQEGAPIDPLTVWLTGYFDTLAGLSPGGRPLTLGDLWEGDRQKGDKPEPADDTPTVDRAINLEVMTTAVSRQMPYAVPFREGAGAYYFDPEEWKLLFPPSVLDWLIECSRLMTEDNVAPAEDGRQLLRLPGNRHLPVVLLVRMSLSFPVLLSAIPLYARDFSGEQEARFAKKVWFSDGGIASNMPLHFFDAPLPGHPTFAVNLKDVHPEHPIDPNLGACDPANGRVYLPTNNSAGLQQFWKAPDDDSPLGLFNLLWSMVETMHNWHDAIQLPMPGYRDRVVQIAQKPDEGGLNLDMPSGHIEALGEAGACAAQRLIERFSSQGGAPSQGWENHREIRMRTFIALAEAQGRHPAIHDPAWKSLLSTGDIRYTPDERKAAVHTLESLERIGPATTRASDLVLLDKAPKPRPVWRIVPRI